MAQPTRIDLERSLRSLAAQGSGLASSLVIPGNTDAPDPTEEYATLTMVSDRAHGTPTLLYQYSSGSMAEHYSQVRMAQYDLQFFGDSASDKAASFSTWIDTAAGILAQNKEDLTIVSHAEIEQVDEIVSEQWETRAIIGFECAYNRSAETAVGTIDSADIRINYDEIIENLEVDNAESL